MTGKRKQVYNKLKVNQNKITRYREVLEVVLEVLEPIVEKIVFLRRIDQMMNLPLYIDVVTCTPHLYVSRLRNKNEKKYT
tara:strand:- start:324 stop:563 length:240 start_codon:yes stop_codon:yes gene_type:complete